ncbi:MULTISPECIES: PH domain-containing protein [unclassified Roseateles]|uniref:PH domain-containing protein n=1 Tax=unclassified Roseateles TaxID=2626991 RepID=UPI0006F541AE|nr:MULTISPECIES: PH domain-containing protein [unclassified Roseateles]KQW45408.1 hypothetical protein ASC81_10830 [Pelomonas sp. Root405]KRA72252.1 hypothetical protein ASD88_10830 [Pelomonas sp. Root662]
MFKRLASEALGLSDIGVIVPAADFNKVDADDYLFSEDGEKIFFLIKSKKDEYCFTNLALVHVDGESAVSSKRVIRRYDYLSHRISGVTLETAGTIDMDVELKFRIGDSQVFSIDVRKNFIEQVKDIYKALHSIGKLQERDDQARQIAMQCLGVTGQMFKLGQEVNEEAVSRHYVSLLNTVNNVVLDKLSRKDYSGVFERYIQN